MEELPQKERSLVNNSLYDHYGLRGMFERVEAAGGQLTLRSGKGQGTTIEIELPLAHNETYQGDRSYSF